MSELFKYEYLDNNCLLIDRKTGSKQIVALDDLIGVDEVEKFFPGKDLYAYEHKIELFPKKNKQIHYNLIAYLFHMRNMEI